MFCQTDISGDRFPQAEPHMEMKIPGHLCLYHLHKCLPISPTRRREKPRARRPAGISGGVRLPSLVEGKSEALGQTAPAQAASLRATHRSLTLFLKGLSLLPALTQCRGAGTQVFSYYGATFRQPAPWQAP